MHNQHRPRGKRSRQIVAARIFDEDQLYLQERIDPREAVGTIGWCDENGLYLDSPAAFAALQRIGQETGEPLPVSRTAWHRALLAKGLLAKRDEGRRTHTYRRTIEGCMPSVLWLCKWGVYRGENTDIADSGESGNSG